MQNKMSGPRYHLGRHHRLKIGAMEQVIHDPQFHPGAFLVSEFTLLQTDTVRIATQWFPRIRRPDACGPWRGAR